MTSYGYELDYSWDHPWPRAPIPKNENERIAELERYQILDTPPDERFNKLCRIACKEMKCPISAVSFIDKSKQWFKANSGLTQAAIPRDVALCSHTIMNPRSAVVVLDTAKDERFKNNPLVTRASSVKFYAAVPLVSKRGACIGSVFVFDVKTHSQCDTKLLQKIAAKVMRYLEEHIALDKVSAQVPATGSPVRSLSSHTTYSKQPQQQQPMQEPQPMHDAANHKVKQSSPVVPKSEPAVPMKTTQTQNGAVAPKPVQVVTPPPASAPEASRNSSAALVPTAAAPVTQERSLSHSTMSPDGQMTNMGTMLMNLLARTTETQQQLAAQQGIMFETLGNHSEQLHSLSETLSYLEKRIDQTMVQSPQKR
jgi:hypothetical protein